MIVLEAVAVALMVGAGAIYVRLSRPEEQELTIVIPKIRNGNMRVMTALLKQDITKLRELTPKERQYAERRRLRLVVEWLPKLSHNVMLFQALGWHLQRRRTASKAWQEWDLIDFKATEMLRKAVVCRFLLVYAQFHFVVIEKLNMIAWPLTQPLVERSLRLCGGIAGEYRAVVRLALRVSAEHGRIHYENLWSVL